MRGWNRGGKALFLRPINAPDPRAARRDEQEDEAVERDRLTAIDDRIKPTAAVHHLVTDRRHAASDEGPAPREQPDVYTAPRKQCDSSGVVAHRIERHRKPNTIPEEFQQAIRTDPP